MLIALGGAALILLSTAASHGGHRPTLPGDHDAGGHTVAEAGSVDRQLARWLTDWRLLAAFVLIGTLLLVSVTLRWHDNRLTLAVQTEALLLRVRERADLRPGGAVPAASGPFLIAGAAAVDGLPSAVATPESGRIELVGEGPLRLGAIHLMPGASLSLQVSPGPALDLLLRGDGRVELLMPAGQRALRVAGIGPQAPAADDKAPLHLIAVAAGGTVPLRVRLPLAAGNPPLAFAEPVAVDLLRFGTERTGREAGPAFRSGLLKGTLRLADTSGELKLRPHEPLRLERLRGELSFIAVAKDSIAIEFAGTARDLFTGGPGFEKDLAPTVLEYLHGQQAVKLLWATFAAVLAALWGMRKWARERGA